MTQAQLPEDFEVEFDSLKCLLLDMARERCAGSVLQLVTSRLAARRPHLALARIWLRRPGDVCDACPMRPECPDQTECLHLVASAGFSEADPEETWTRIDGRFRRFPIGVRKIGQVAARRELVRVEDVAADPTWISDLEWARREGIRGFAGVPMLFQGELIGVLAIFLRIPTRSEEGPTWLRMIADHASAAIANARAFEQIERLKQQLELENEYLREEVAEVHSFGEIIGQSSALKKALQQIELVAPTDANVLILGESGTGKELVARAIHERSSRREHPLIKVNCASIPRELFESEFFGHVKGSFSGAHRDRRGRFELADGGTLFLDEVGEIPLELQGKLLRVLQESTFERIGEEQTRHVDVRIVAATNRDLQAEVAAGRFRQDLYFRLSVFPIELVPLRERPEDIAPLAEHFIAQAARRLGCDQIALKRRHVIELQRHAWPGNVRELQNVIERAVITARCGELRFDLPVPARSETDSPLRATRVPDEGLLTWAELKERERVAILAVLEAADWQVAGRGGAAALLGMKPTTLASRIKKLGLRRPR